MPQLITGWQSASCLDESRSKQQAISPREAVVRPSFVVRANILTDVRTQRNNDMKPLQRPSKTRLEQSEYWMRSISFAGLHRILKAVADFPNGLRAGELNKLVQNNSLSLIRRNSYPAPTTLYHYRNTLLHLRALKRDGRMLRVNDENPDVCNLLRQPASANGDQSLSDSTREAFAALVLNNEQCRSLFFDLFMPLGVSSNSVTSFRQRDYPLDGPASVPRTLRRSFFET